MTKQTEEDMNMIDLGAEEPVFPQTNNYVYVVVDTTNNNEVYGVYSTMELAKQSIEGQNQEHYNIQGIKLNH